jgi:hypothetical protein
MRNHVAYHISPEIARQVIPIYECLTCKFIILHVHIPQPNLGPITTPSGLHVYCIKCTQLTHHQYQSYKCQSTVQHIWTSPRVDINDNQLSKPIVQQYPPLALMATLRHGNTHAHAPPMIITPHQCFYLSPFDINGKWYLPLGMPPLSL